VTKRAWRSAGRAGLVAAAGFALSFGSGGASDFGGECCAALEERIAELEAAAARKGTRREGITVSGQINRLVLHWNDGHDARTYYGLDNTNSSSRFIVLGESRLNAAVRIGFEVMVEIEAGGTSSKVSQLDEDGKMGASDPLGNGLSFAGASLDAAFADGRRAALWIEHSRLGRLTLGRYESAGVVNTIDLGGIGVVACYSFSLLNGGLFLRGTDGTFKSITWANLLDVASSQGRTELARWDSPTLAGFSLSGSVAEAADYWGAMVRYAEDWKGVRVAWGIGYERAVDAATPAAIDAVPPAASQRPDIRAWGTALSLLHLASGLFAQGHYQGVDYGEAATAVSGYWNQATANKSDANQWLVQLGMTRNWSGHGNTAVYGEYGVANDWGASPAGRNYAASAACPSPPFGGSCQGAFTPVTGVTGTRASMWGVGVVQYLDAAATELYLGYRNWGARIASAAAEAPVEELRVLAAGARIKF
jgi:hypothetical protein